MHSYSLNLLFWGCWKWHPVGYDYFARIAVVLYWLPLRPSIGFMDKEISRNVAWFISFKICSPAKIQAIAIRHSLTTAYPTIRSYRNLRNGCLLSNVIRRYRFCCQLTGIFVNGNDKLLLSLIQTITDTSPVTVKIIEIGTNLGNLLDCGQHLTRNYRIVG